MVAQIRTKYESDTGLVHPIRIRPDTNDAIGAAPAGVVTSSIRVQISKSNREAGIRPRQIRIARVVGAGQITYSEYATLPVLTPGAFNKGSFVVGGSVNYKGVDWDVVSLIPEDVN